MGEDGVGWGPDGVVRGRQDEEWARLGKGGDKVGERGGEGDRCGR